MASTHVAKPGPDLARQHKARLAIHEHRDALLKRAEKVMDWGGILQDKKDRAYVAAHGTLMALLGMSAYVVVILLWFKVYHDSFSTTVIWLGFLLLASICMVVGSRAEILGRERPWLRWAGGVFLLSALVGTVVGFMLYFRSLAYYFKYESLRSYTNVGASQNAEAFADAGMFLWTEDTRLDPMRSVGFQSRWTGSTYCAAPIVDGSMSMTDPIYFWAVGEGCCSARASFTCDDATTPTVRSALVMLEPDEVVRPFMKWAVRGAVYPKYEQSVKLHQAEYNSVAPPKIKMVQWVKDPIAAKDAFYNDAAIQCAWVSILYFFVLEALCCLIMAKFVIMPKRVENAVRQVAGPLAQKPAPP